MYWKYSQLIFQKVQISFNVYCFFKKNMVQLHNWNSGATPDWLKNLTRGLWKSRHPEHHLIKGISVKGRHFSGLSYHRPFSLFLTIQSKCSIQGLVLQGNALSAISNIKKICYDSITNIERPPCLRCSSYQIRMSSSIIIKIMTI